MTVHVAARVAALAEAGEVLLSRTIKDLVAGSGISSRIEGRTISRASPKHGRCRAEV